MAFCHLVVFLVQFQMLPLLEHASILRMLPNTLL
jgi:hypothetical protein